MTFADAAAEYLRFAEQDRGCKPSTVRGYRNAIKVHLLPVFGSMKLDEITVQEIERWRAGMLSVRMQRELSNKTKNNLLVLMHAIFRHAVKVYGLPANPVAPSQTRAISSAISPLRRAVMRCQLERSSTARSSPSGLQKPARISISMAPGYDRQPAIRPGSAPPSTSRTVCVIPAKSVPIPKSRCEIRAYSALGPERIPAKRLFPTWRRLRT